MNDSHTLKKVLFFRRKPPFFLKNLLHRTVLYKRDKHRVIQLKEWPETSLSLNPSGTPWDLPLLWDTVQELTVGTEFFLLNTFRMKTCWYLLVLQIATYLSPPSIVFWCIIFSPFYAFAKWKSLRKTADVFSLLILDFKLLHLNMTLTQKSK